MEIIPAFGNIGWFLKTYMVFLYLNKTLAPPPPPTKSVTITSKQFVSVHFNCILGKVKSIFDSEITNISKFVIVSLTIPNLFLMELMFKLTTIKVLKCSRRCIFNFV